MQFDTYWAFMSLKDLSIISSMVTSVLLSIWSNLYFLIFNFAISNTSSMGFIYGVTAGEYV